MTLSKATRVFDTLRTIIAPGKRARLSPYVQAAQFMTLFNEMPDCTRRYESEQQILETHAAHIERMAHCWVAFYKSGQDFGTNTYTDRDFLDAYLAYYFSVNVPKVQLVLLDLARRGLLPNQLNVLDLGVGTGATAVGVLDFVVAWEEVCALYNQERPCGGVRLAGMDRSETALEYASKVVTAYGQALKARAEAMGESSTSSVPGWAVSAEWQQLNLNSEWPSPPFEPNVVFLMNTLNELNDTGRCRVAEYLSNLTEGTLVVAVEPGKEELARSLMGWRPELVSAGCFTSLAPCGEHSDLMHCERCWHMRRESMHQHRLYSAFVEACNRHIQSNTDRLDPFSNKLLSWSYFILRKEEPARLPSKHIRTSIRHGERLIEPTALRYIGSYRDREPVDDPPDNVKSAEYLKVCPSVFDNTEGLVVKREPGTQIPPLSYGQDFVIRNATVLASKVNGVFALIPDAETVFDSGRQTDKENVFLPEYSDETRAAVDAIAFRIFGFPSMRDFQHQTLARVLRGESILAIAATGGGKSECFILPAMLLPGVTIVVSSLKSLMADQYEQRIKKRFGLDHLATYINGDVSARERQHRLRRMELGYYKLVYLTPEQMERGYVLDSIRRTNESVGIRYLAMDEAHCISHWGHDFRPAYLNILRRLKEIGVNPVVIALTATASENVRKDICEELKLNGRMIEEGGDVLVHSSNRPELNLVVRVKRSTEEKAEEIAQELQRLVDQNKKNETSGAAIVFMPHTGGDPDATAADFRRNNRHADSNGHPSGRGKCSAGVTHFASYLERRLQKRVAIYHSKMESGPDGEESNDSGESPVADVSPKELGDLSGRSRQSEQADFIEGCRDIMVATKGFGMGINKPDIRLVMHRTPPGNLEAYAQEAGRAGRDGAPATAILFYSPDSTDDGPYRVRSDYDQFSAPFCLTPPWFLAKGYVA